MWSQSERKTKQPQLVATARAAVATGAWVKSKHEMYLIRGSMRA